MTSDIATNDSLLSGSKGLPSKPDEIELNTLLMMKQFKPELSPRCRIIGGPIV